MSIRTVSRSQSLRFAQPACGARVWPENSIRRIPSSTKGYTSVRNFGICESAIAPETPRITQETPKSWTLRIPPARQPFITDTSVAAVMTAWLDRAGEVGLLVHPARHGDQQKAERVQAL